MAYLTVQKTMLQRKLPRASLIYGIFLIVAIFFSIIFMALMDDPDIMLPTGTFFGITSIGAAVSVVMDGFSGTIPRFTIPVSMGQTRKGTLFGIVAMDFLVGVVAAIVTCILTYFHYEIYRMIFPHLEVEGLAELLHAYVWYILLGGLGIILGMLVLEMFSMAAIMKWGGKGVLVVLIPCYLPMFLNFFIDAAGENPESAMGQVGLALIALGGFLVTIPGIVLMVVVVLLLLSLAVWYLMRCPLRL